MQAQQLLEDWIEEQVIKIDENKYVLLTLCVAMLASMFLTHSPFLSDIR